MTNQSVYSIKLDDTQISAKSRSLHYSMAQLLLQNRDEPPRVYTLEGHDKTLLVTNGLCATLFVDGSLCFKGGFALDDTYHSQRFSYDVVTLEPGQRFKYLTEATLDSSVAEYRELVLYENENVPAAIVQYLNEVYANELDFIGKLPPGQQFILRQNLLKLGSPVLFANGGSAVVLKNWRETFQHLNYLCNTKFARKSITRSSPSRRIGDRLTRKQSLSSLTTRNNQRCHACTVRVRSTSKSTERAAQKT